MNMNNRPPQLLFLTLLIAAAIAANGENNGESVVEWLRSNGGFVNTKVEIRHPDHDAFSRVGLYANDNINENELLFSIPPHCLITSVPQEPFNIGDRISGDFEGEGEWFDGTVTAVRPDGTYDVHYDDGADENGVELERLREFYAEEIGSMDCRTAFALVKEMRLGEASEFSAYVNYLLAQKQGQLPSAWSTAGKDLLQEVLGRTSEGNTLPPYDAVSWLEDVFYPMCHGGDDPLEQHAALLVVQRGWDDIMVPLFDMLNHRNGRWLNTKSNSPHNLENDAHVEVRASRDIDAGEEIYNTYNFCPDCEGRADRYGTPEMLRDYGFVEQYPQRWIFHDENLAFELDEIDDEDGYGSGELEVTWIHKEADKRDPTQFLPFLQRELQRLKDVAEIELESPTEGIPEYEWDVIWQYHAALVVAMTHAIQAAHGDGMEECTDEDDTCSLSYDRYDPLEEEEDRLTRDTETCDVDTTFSFPDYDIIDEPYSPYHAVVFFQDPENLDTCFELDKIVQICSSYRPHYHEMVVHNTARFLETVERVVFVGGGDSMLLHEILKYPSLDVVVGLELDQKVTRNSFKHFGTQPHWDNGKVQWWYGDATKSLLMLPDDYFGSFDMVLVDLSETVMSFKVTGELDVLEALSLLLKPEGIFVKNEMYLEKLSDIFDHTMHIHFYDCPVVCSQSLILGSNKVDFLYGDLIDHNTDSLYVKPLDQITDRYEIVHDIRKRNLRKQCNGGLESIKDPEKQEKSPGILMIVDAEEANCTLYPPNELRDNIVKALERARSKVISVVVSDTEERMVSVVVVMSEGYVVTRTWPEHRYCALDIHLWSSFEKHEGIREAILAAIGGSSGSSSSYRIVAGGMFGVSTWKEDEKNRGPRVTQLCDPPDLSQRNLPSEQGSIDAVLSESMDFVPDNDVLVAVVCGEETQPCHSLEVLETHDKVGDLFAIRTCPNLEDGSTRLLDCEKAILEELKEETEEEKIRVIVLDASAPYPMARVVHSIFLSERNMKRFLTQDVMVLATMVNETESWRRNFLEKFRRDILMWEPVFRTEVLFNSPRSSLEMGVVSSGDFRFIHHLKEIVSNIEKRTGLVSEVRNIQGGLWRFLDEFEPSQFFTPRDYDQSSPLKQWSSQQPLGFQTVFQLEEIQNSDSPKLSTVQVRDGLENALAKMNTNEKASVKVEQFDNVGDGCMLAALWPEGSAVVLWDGKTHIDINLFTYAESAVFASAFLENFEAINVNLKMMLRDEQPRGFGRVVNFKSDIEPGVVPHWAVHMQREEPSEIF